MQYSRKWVVVSGSVPHEGQTGDSASLKRYRYAWRGAWLERNWAKTLAWRLVSFVAIFIKLDTGVLGSNLDALSYLGDVRNSFSWLGGINPDVSPQEQIIPSSV